MSFISYLSSDNLEEWLEKCRFKRKDPWTAGVAQAEYLFSKSKAVRSNSSSPKRGGIYPYIFLSLFCMYMRERMKENVCEIERASEQEERKDLICPQGPLTMADLWKLLKLQDKCPITYQLP